MPEQRQNADRPDGGPFPVSSSAGSLFRRLQPERTPPAALEPPQDASAPTPEEDLPHVSPFTTNNLTAGGPPAAAPPATRPPATPTEAMQRLDERMERAGREFSGGTITRSQYQAIQSYYAERKALIQRLVERSPDTNAWQRAAVASEGYGHLLLQQDEATVDGLALFDNWSGSEIQALGFFDVPQDVLTLMLSAMGPAGSQPAGVPHARQLDDGRWITTVRGTFTTAVAVFSARPSAVQLGWQGKLHQDFEHDNQPALEAGYLDPRALTYPQQALFPFD